MLRSKEWSKTMTRLSKRLRSTFLNIMEHSRTSSCMNWVIANKWPFHGMISHFLLRRPTSGTTKLSISLHLIELSSSQTSIATVWPTLQKETWTAMNSLRSSLDLQLSSIRTPKRSKHMEKLSTKYCTRVFSNLLIRQMGGTSDRSTVTPLKWMKFFLKTSKLLKRSTKQVNSSNSTAKSVIFLWPSASAI